MDHPNVYQHSTLDRLQRLVERIVERSPDLASRVRLAAGILANGKIATVDGVTFEAVASDDATLYRVDLSSDEQGCSCGDYRHRGIRDPRGRRSCKHVLAGILYNALGARPQSGARAARIAAFRPVRTCGRLTRKAA